MKTFLSNVKESTRLMGIIAKLKRKLWKQSKKNVKNGNMMSQEIVLYRTKDTTAARNNVIKYGVYKDILPH